MNSKMTIMISILLLPVNSLVGMQPHKFNVGNLIMPCTAVAGVVVAGISFGKLNKLYRARKKSRNIKEKILSVGKIEHALEHKIFPKGVFDVETRNKLREEGLGIIAAQEELILGVEQKGWKNEAWPERTRLGLVTKSWTTACCQCGKTESDENYIKANNHALIHCIFNSLFQKEVRLFGHSGPIERDVSKKAWQLGTLGALGISMGAFAAFAMIRRK